MEFTFKIGQKIKEAWPTYKAHFSTFLIMMLVMSGIQYIGTKENFITMIIYYLALTLFMYVFLRFVIGLVDKKENNSFSKEMFPSMGQYWNLLKTLILSGLCILAGFILLVVPGFYVAGRLVFANYISVDKNKGGRASIKESWEMTRGYGWRLFWKSFVIGLFVMIGFIAIFIGSFITYPIGILVLVMMYREFYKMKSQMPKEEVKAEVVKDLPKETIKEEVKEEVPVEAAKEDISKE